MGIISLKYYENLVFLTGLICFQLRASGFTLYLVMLEFVSGHEHLCGKRFSHAFGAATLWWNSELFDSDHFSARGVHSVKRGLCEESVLQCLLLLQSLQKNQEKLLLIFAVFVLLIKWGNDAVLFLWK